MTTLTLYKLVIYYEIPANDDILITKNICVAFSLDLSNPCVCHASNKYVEHR